MLEAIVECDNDALYSQFSWIVDYKWEKVKKYCWMEALFQFAFFLALCYHLNDDRNADHTTCMILLTTFSVISILYEMVQAFKGSLVDHFADFWNWLDLLGSGSVLFVTCRFWFSDTPESNG